MNKEDKSLLIQDLCARSPYGVKTSNGYGILKLSPKTDVIYIVDNGHIPYLRLMSSMTEEETKECHKVIIKSQNCSFENSESATTMVNDWLLSKGFDVRGLISKGLAIEVTESNNPYKE